VVAQREDVVIAKAGKPMAALTQYVEAKTKEASVGADVIYVSSVSLTELQIESILGKIKLPKIHAVEVSKSRPENTAIFW